MVAATPRPAAGVARPAGGYRAFGLLANCFAKPSETASCVQGAGSPFRRRQARLRRKLLHVRPSLKADCRELRRWPRLATGQIAGALEALRAAGTPSGSAEPARHAVRLQQLQTDDAAGCLTRFVALCSDDRARPPLR